MKLSRTITIFSKKIDCIRQNDINTNLVNGKCRISGVNICMKTSYMTATRVIINFKADLFETIIQSLQSKNVTRLFFPI